MDIPPRENVLHFADSMKKLLVLGSLLVAVARCAPIATPPSAARPASFDFSRTIRVDYLHTGGPGGEALALDRVIAEGPWPGSRTRVVDETNLGDYFFEVADAATKQVMYSRGFSSIYAEWITTPEVNTANRSFQESLRFPWPKARVRVTLKKRDAQNAFQTFWSIDIDPNSAMVKRWQRPAAANIWPVVESGQPSEKVDLLLMSEGYSAGELPKFHADAARLLNALFELEPFRSRRNDFNVRALDLPGKRLSVQGNIFGLERYLLTYDNRALRDLAASAPYDAAIILTNDEKYGGGGIFNLQSTVAAGAKASEYVFIHELAHNLAGLGDEYVGNVTYITGAAIQAEPWKPNLTALLDPTRLKWRDLVEPGTPIPTPMSFAGKVGAFEGAGYEAKGLYRGEADCIMFSRNPVGFCRVCRRAIDRVLDTYTKR
jgi:hypothetical protein